MPAGRAIATGGENGFQAEVPPPGVSFRPLMRLTHDLDRLPMAEIPNGAYGRIQAADGAPMPSDQVLADSWPEAEAARMLDARWFLGEASPGAEPRGQRGVQTSILKPGRYPSKLYLFQWTCGCRSAASPTAAEGRASWGRGRRRRPAPRS